MGLRPTQGDEKTGPVQQLLLLEAPPSPLSSRPEESWVVDPPKGMKNGSCSATTVAGSAALPFVISTGEVMGLRPTQGDENGSCSATTVAGSAALPFVISTGEVMGRWPAEGDEKRFSSNYCRWKRRPPLCHLDRSAA
jgi:hypothetical protein